MSTEQPGFATSFDAGADLSANQFYPVILGSTGRVTIPGGQGVYAIGVLQNKPAAAGRSATVMCSGITKVRAGAAIDVSTSRYLTTNTDGVETAASGDYIIGYCIEDADVVEGDYFRMMLCPTPVPLA